jgi:hypothetical protein
LRYFGVLQREKGKLKGKGGWALEIIELENDTKPDVDEMYALTALPESISGLKRGVLATNIDRCNVRG